MPFRDHQNYINYTNIMANAWKALITRYSLSAQ